MGWAPTKNNQMQGIKTTRQKCIDVLSVQWNLEFLFEGSILLLRRHMVLVLVLMRYFLLGHFPCRFMCEKLMDGQLEVGSVVRLQGVIFSSCICMKMVVKDVSTERTGHARRFNGI